MELTKEFRDFFEGSFCPPPVTPVIVHYLTVIREGLSSSILQKGFAY